MKRTDTARPAAASGTYQLGGDLPVHRLGYGAMRLTGEGIWGEPDDPEQARAVLRRAVELGVDLIDTADSYGPEVSERLIAEALHPYPEHLVIATKAGFVRTGPGRWHVLGRPEYLRQQCELSLRRLRVEAIDLFQLHRIDRRVPVEEQLGLLADLRAEGKVRHVGLSEVDVAQLDRARGVVEIASVQNRYNLLDRGHEAVLERCEELGIAFIPWYPVAVGDLARPGGVLDAADRGHEAVLERCEELGIAFIPWYPVAVGDLARPGGVLDAAARRHEATPAQVALAWLLHRSPVMLPIPGTSSVAHLEENCAAALVELDEDAVDLDVADPPAGGGSASSARAARVSSAAPRAPASSRRPR